MQFEMNLHKIQNMQHGSAPFSFIMAEKLGKSLVCCFITFKQHNSKVGNTRLLLSSSQTKQSKTENDIQFAVIGKKQKITTIWEAENSKCSGISSLKIALQE